MGERLSIPRGVLSVKSVDIRSVDMYICGKHLSCSIYYPVCPRCFMEKMGKEKAEAQRVFIRGKALEERNRCYQEVVMENHRVTCKKHDVSYLVSHGCIACAEENDTIVTNPPHYTKGIECIDFIESQGLDKDYHLANAIKYIVRCRHKGKLEEDIKKAIWYLTRRLERE